MSSSIRIARLAAQDKVVSARWDEFVFVLSGCDIAAAEAKRQQICRTIEQMAFQASPGRIVHVTVSSGMAVYPADANTYEGLVAAADCRMYTEKAQRQPAVIA